MAISNYGKVAMLSLLLWGGSAQAEDGLRCGVDLLRPGASRLEVRGACGEPDDEIQSVELRERRYRSSAPCPDDSTKRCATERARTEEVVVDKWYYDLGPQRFMRIVHFEQGQMTGVSKGPYGKKDPNR